MKGKKERLLKKEKKAAFKEAQVKDQKRRTKSWLHGRRRKEEKIRKNMKDS